MARKIALLMMVLVTLATYGCTHVQRGAAIGAATGAAIGVAYADFGHSGTSNGEGAAVGAVVGGLIGALLADAMDSDDADVDYSSDRSYQTYDSDAGYQHGPAMK